MAQKLKYLDFVVPNTGDVATALAGVDVQLDHLASPNMLRHVIFEAHVSYSAPPTGGELQVLDSAGNIVYRQAVVGTNLAVSFDPPIASEPGKQLSLKLLAGGPAVIGAISSLHSTVKG